MLLSTKSVTGHHLAARDGEIGEVSALLFDDRTWTVRYVVGRTMRWLGRYDWPVWWGAPGAVASIPMATAESGATPSGAGDPHLRSTSAVADESGREPRPNPQTPEEKLDEALDDTFPASDPVQPTPEQDDDDVREDRGRR